MLFRKQKGRGSQLHQFPDLKGRPRGGQRSLDPKLGLEQQTPSGSDRLGGCGSPDVPSPGPGPTLPPACSSPQPRPEQEEQSLTAARRNGNLGGAEAFNTVITDNYDTAEEHRRWHYFNVGEKFKLC